MNILTDKEIEQMLIKLAIDARLKLITGDELLAKFESLPTEVREAMESLIMMDNGRGICNLLAKAKNNQLPRE